jgi:hypothetical protein
LKKLSLSNKGTSPFPDLDGYEKKIYHLFISLGGGGGYYIFSIVRADLEIEKTVLRLQKGHAFS